MSTRVILNRKVNKDIKKLPQLIKLKFYIWIKYIEENGLYRARYIKGFNDEALSGNRKGQRSVRLNKAYRAIYIERASNLELIEVIEVNKHDY